MARFDVRRGTCEADKDTTHVTGHPFRSQIYDYNSTWRVREYLTTGDDTLSTFTDTTMSQPYGIAADDQGRVYVAGIAVVLDTSQTDQRIRTRRFASRVYRYVRGPLGPGIQDPYMPGSLEWHRDPTWLVLDGSGNSSISDPRGIEWAPDGSNALFIADRENNQVKAVSTQAIGQSIVSVDGQTTGSNLNHPEDVATDRAGFFYLVDRENHRVLRYDRAGNSVQRVDEKPNAHGLPLLDPTAVTADSSLVYVADRGRGQIIVYNRIK